MNPTEQPVCFPAQYSNEDLIQCLIGKTVVATETVGGITVWKVKEEK